MKYRQNLGTFTCANQIGAPNSFTLIRCDNAQHDQES